MSVRSRILMIQLSEKLKQNPDYAKKIGVNIEFHQIDAKRDNRQAGGGEVYGKDIV